MSMTQKLKSFVKGVFTKAEDVKEAAEARMEEKEKNMKDAAKHAGDSMKGKAESIKESAKSEMKDVKNAAKSAAENMKEKGEAMKDAAKSKMENVKEKGEAMKDAAKSKMEGMDMQDAKNIAKDAVESIKQKGENLKEAVKSTIQGHMDVASNADFDKMVKQAKGPVIISFYRGTEGDGRRNFPSLSADKNKEGYTVLRADMDKVKDVAKFMKVDIPSAVLMYNGKVVEMAKDEAGLDRIIKRANDLARE